MVPPAVGTEVPGQSRRRHATDDRRQHRRAHRRWLRRSAPTMTRSWRSVTVAAAVALAAACRGAPPAPYAPRDTALRREPLSFYPAQERPARAVVLFPGDALGFWE